MKFTHTLSAACLLLASTTPVLAAEETEALAAEGAALIKSLAEALQAELGSALKADGPVAAVEVCQVSAQDLTYGVSDSQEGWDISRSSHLLRNPANVADDYTAAKIDAFLARAAAGEAVAPMVSAEIVEDGDQRVFRMVKAIPTGEVCLTCHGSTEVSAEVEAVIAEYYPEDAARGFALGDMRGVFTLNKVLE